MRKMKACNAIEITALLKNDARFRMVLKTGR
jgi:hypothetical protein